VRWFVRPAGVLIEDVGASWVAYSPLTGGSHLINDESAAVLDVLVGAASLSEEAVVTALAVDFGVSVEQVRRMAAPGWTDLEAAGLIRIFSQRASDLS
jgi:PqqD family protein of HPr-rel-A system